MLKNLKIGVRLGIGFGVIVLLAVLVTVLAITRIKVLDKDINLVVNDRMPKVATTNAWIEAVNEVGRLLRNEVISSNAQFIAKEDESILEKREEMNKIVDTLTTSIKSDEGKAKLKAAEDILPQIRGLQDKIRTYAKNNNDTAAATLLFGEYRTVQAAYLKAINDLIEFQEQLAVSDGEEAAKLADSTATLLIILLVAAVIIAVALAWFITTSIIKPVNQCIDIAQKVAAGDTSVAISVNSTDETGILLSALKGMVEKLNSLILDMNDMSKQHDLGDIDVKISEDKYDNAFKQMASGVNAMVFGHIAVKKKAMACVGEFGKGNMDAPLEKFPGKKVFINDTIEQVRVNIKALVSDAGMLAQAAVDGKLSTRADASKHQGDFRKIVQGVNDTLDSVINPLNVAASYVDQISKGAIPAKITDSYNGDFNTIKNNLNTCIDAVNKLVADAEMLSKAAVEGKLGTRADASKHQGDFRSIVKGVNDTLDAVVSPMEDAARVLKALSQKNLTATITNNYQGQFAELKENINTVVENMRNTRLFVIWCG